MITVSGLGLTHIKISNFKFAFILKRMKCETNGQSVKKNQIMFRKSFRLTYMTVIIVWGIICYSELKISNTDFG